MRNILAKAATAALALSASTSFATTVDTSFPEVWFSNQVGGNGAQLSFIDAPGAPETIRTGKTAFFAFYTNTEVDGSPIWVATSFNPIPGVTTYTVPLITSSGGSFVPGAAVNATNLDNDAVLTVHSCERITLDVTPEADFDGIAAGSIEFTADLTGAVEGSSSICPYVNEVPETTADTDTICAAGGGSALSAGVCSVPGGIYTQDLTWANNVLWLYDGQVEIGDGTTTNTLNVEAGATVAGQPNSVLVIKQNANIIAEGNAESPIIFTSAADVDPALTPASGDVAGIVITGLATINGCTDTSVTCVLTDEALNQFPYGGDNDLDSSGRMRYVQVRYTGREVLPDREIQGLSLFGVGAGTVFDYISIFRSTDDGIEFFGGTANVRHLIVVGAEDDSIDWGFGWRGKVQYALVLQEEGFGDRGIEADSNEDNFDLEPRSQGQFANLGIIGASTADNGAKIRRGTLLKMWNSWIIGTGDECIDWDDAPTYTAAGTPGAPTGDHVYANNLFDCVNGPFEDSSSDPYNVSDFISGFPGIETGTTLTVDGYIPAPGSSVYEGFIGIDAEPGEQPDSDFFDLNNYVGPFASPNDDWTKPWSFGLPAINR